MANRFSKRAGSNQWCQWRTAVLLTTALVATLSVSLAAFAASDQAANSESAIVIGADSFARSQVVALGRDLVVRGTVHTNASVLRGNATVSGSIGGDLVVLEGSVQLEDGARIGGDVVVLGGAVSSASNVTVDGRILAYPHASRALLALIEVPSLGGRPVLLSAKLGLLLAWWLAGTLLVSCFSGPMLRTGALVAEQPMGSFVLGVTFVLTVALGFIILSSFSPALISLPLVVLAVVLAFVLKLWGSVAVVLALGRWLAGRWSKLPRDLLGQFLVGLCVIGALKLVPWLGATIWSMITLVGMGAALKAGVQMSGQKAD